MKRHPKYLSLNEAADLMIEAGVIETRLSIGTNRTATELAIPAGTIDANERGLFSRSDVCRLIGYAQMDKRT